jgi:protein involved in polysaccharide export with SLBB domain
MVRRGLVLCLAVSLQLLLSACVGPEITINTHTVYSQPMPTSEIPYLLGPGDVLEIIYHIVPQPREEEYTIAVGDKLFVEVRSHNEVNRELVVRPDGKITLAVKGDIQAAGLTSNKLRQNIVKVYSDTFRDPVVTVTLVEYNQAINQLKQAITTASRGQSKIAAVRPDGYVSFPLLPDIKAAGLTIPELKARLEEHYAAIIQNLSISLIVEQMKSNLVYVLGEVKNPNVYLMEGPTTLVQILSRAGGPLDSGKLDSVLIVSRNSEGKPVGKVVDVEKILGAANSGLDIVLNQYDVVYVSKTKIAKANVFVEQYFNRIIPEFLRTGVSAFYPLK